MSISCGECSCDGEPGMTVWYSPEDYSEYTAARSKLCNGCKTVRIKKGDVCTEIQRYKYAEYDIEISIYGDDGEVPRASHHLCETCSDIYFSITEIGYCVSRYDQLKSDLQEAAFYEYAHRMDKRFQTDERHMNNKDCAEYPVGSVFKRGYGEFFKKDQAGLWVDMHDGQTTESPCQYRPELNQKTPFSVFLPSIEATS